MLGDIIAIEVFEEFVGRKKQKLHAKIHRTQTVYYEKSRSMLIGVLLKFHTRSFEVKEG